MSTPPFVSIFDAKGRPLTDLGADFRMAIVGSASDPLVPAGLSVPYGNSVAFVSDNGIGDGVDAMCHVLTPSDDNPQPNAAIFYATPATTPGVRGVTLTPSVTGGSTVVVSKTATTPLGTWEPTFEVVEGGTVGTAGVVLRASPNAGRNWFPTASLGTASTFKMQIPNPGGSPIDTGVQWDFSPASADLTALNTLINEEFTDFNAHVILVGGSPVHGSTGLVDVLSAGTYPSATNTATRVARVNAIRLAYIAHIGRVSGSPQIHITQDVTAGDQLAYGAATDDSTALLLALDLKAKLNLHEANTTVHTNADATNTVTSATPAMGVFVAGDRWDETKTVPPQWAIGDLYTAGTPATGALPAIARGPTNVGLVAITEPVVAGDIATLSTALTACTALVSSFRPTLIVRFRDQAVGESDATYVAAWIAFRTACASDNRIAVWVNDGWLTDAFRGYIYSRSGLPALLARIQGMAAIPGEKGERVAQAPGWTKRGPLPGFTIRDTSGNKVGHDERDRPGILGRIGGRGGGMCCYYESHEARAGTYVNVAAPVLFDVLPTVVSLMDSRISQGIKRILYATAFDVLGGAAIVTDSVLEQSACDAMAGAASADIAAAYPNEFANPLDPNLVRVSHNVTVDEDGNVTVTWYVNNRLFDYINGVLISIGNVRS